MITHESSLEDFSSQLDYVISEYTNHELKADQFQNIVLGGLGGSGIGGTIAKNWLNKTFPLPIETINNYNLPNYVNEHSLVVLNSYSGNTEETLSLLEQALSKKAQIVVMCSGGKIKDLASKNKLKTYSIQTGFQPRMTIGFGLTYLLLILSELTGTNLREKLTEISHQMREKQEAQIESALRVFNFFKSSLKNKFVVLADPEMLAVATRFSQQMNENPKLECFVHAVPECNHNVIESYTDRLPTNFIMLYTNQHENIEARFEFLTGHLEMDNNKVLPMFIPKLELFTIYDVIYRLDWVSVMIANELGAPLMEVPIIMELKNYLASIQELNSSEPDSEEELS
ncbi:MAG: glucose/mannose-6-phosphate isomerase [Bacteroidia bacterium]|jgi:glucose/mannose-6-phosphate isomerase